MSKAQFCQLAHVYSPKHSIAGQYVSEKLDGMRAIWDGGVSRGVLKSQVPYANTFRDERYVVPPKATGLWSRYGNIIHAPNWFLDALPRIPLDLELYAGCKRFQFVMSTVKDLHPSTDWLQIQAIVLDSMPIAAWLSPREINERNCKITITAKAKSWWVNQRADEPYEWPTDKRPPEESDSAAASTTFEGRLRFIKSHLVEQTFLKLHTQTELPFDTRAAEQLVKEMMLEINEKGGEGLVIKRRRAQYVCERSWDVLKVKPDNDAEATVVGYVWGDLPDNTRSTTGEAVGKYMGMMGSLICEFEGKQFKLSGFTDEERRMTFVDSGNCAADEGYLNPGKVVDAKVHNQAFPRGSVVTFRYRELSDDNVPKEARYDRRRAAE